MAFRGLASPVALGGPASCRRIARAGWNLENTPPGKQRRERFRENGYSYCYVRSDRVLLVRFEDLEQNGFLSRVQDELGGQCTHEVAIADSECAWLLQLGLVAPTPWEMRVGMAGPRGK